MNLHDNSTAGCAGSGNDGDEPYRDCLRVAVWMNRWLDDWDEELPGDPVWIGDALSDALTLAADIFADTKSFNGGPAPDGAFLRRLGMSYADYLRTPHWQRVRRRALLRSGGICRSCHRETYALDVHHQTYARLGAERDGDVLAICRPCHAREHGLVEGRS
jgi:hypothetical protein